MWRLRGCVRRRAALLLALCFAICAALGGGPTLSAGGAEADATLPGAEPARLARLLADFAEHKHLLPHVGSWAIEEEAGNYTWWRYAVAFECGAGCEGRAEVASLDDHAGGERHQAQGPPRAHRVLVALRECRTKPLLPWPAACESWSTAWSVERAAGGARVRARASASCGALRVLAGGCATEMRARLQSTLRMLADRIH